MESPTASKKSIPPAPASPGPPTMARYRLKKLIIDGTPLQGQCCASIATRNMWDRLFDEGYRADVAVNTENGGVIYAHSNILEMASPVLKGMLNKSKRQGRSRSILIRGVPSDAVRIFIRFLYSSCYEKAELEENIMPLLVMSHVYLVPQLKKLCAEQLELRMLNTENVTDIFQLALLCDAPRLSLICYRMILRNLKAVSVTDGWKAMKKSHPVLEKDLLQSLIAETNIQKERFRKRNERKTYLQLYEAMEAIVHIFKDGCQTIGPHDKVFREDHPPCTFESCKGLELLFRHFAGCKSRVSGSCVQCKRMGQLLELHSRLCTDSDMCRVPLCRNLKERIKKQNKKDEMRWRILARNILRTKNIGGAPFFSWAAVNSL